MTIRKTCAVIPFLIMSSVTGVNAEVKLDGTLGTQGNIAGPNYAIEAAMGKQQGVSLFHSFEKFNVGTGESAVFRGPADVERIISRVTGGSASNIDGLIKSEIQGADFYFINPFGMIFGPNASLDITGSFYATSADYVKLGQNGRFDAKNPQNTVLTADAPEKFGFLGQKPGDITVQTRRETGTDAETGTPEYSGLEVNGDSRMMLAGGDIKIDNGIVQTHSGNLDVAAVSSAGELDIESYDVRYFESLAKIEIDNWASVITTNGGNIACRGESIEIQNGASIITQTQKRGENGGDIDVKANSYLTISGKSPCGQLASSIKTISVNAPESDSGNINISTKSINVENGGGIKSIVYNSGSTGKISIDTVALNVIGSGEIYTGVNHGSGDAKDISINASESVIVSGFDELTNFHSQICSDVCGVDGLSNNSGTITITTPYLKLDNQSMIFSSSWSELGNPGNIFFNVCDFNSFASVIGTYSHFLKEPDNNTGDIRINSINSIVFNGSVVNVGGNLSISAHNMNLADCSYISMNNGACEINLSGFLVINSNNESNSDVFSSNISRFCGIDTIGNSRIDVNADEVQILDSCWISSTIGTVNLNVNKLALLSGGHILTYNNHHNGIDSGCINVNAADSIYISDHVENDIDPSPWEYIFSCSGIFSIVKNLDSSNAGDIYIKTPELTIDNHAAIGSTTLHSGNSGNIFFDVEKISINQKGYIDTSVTTDIEDSPGAGGSIYINNAKDVVLQEDAALITGGNWGVAGDSGDIVINTDRISMFNHSEIDSSTHSDVEGMNGDIVIKAKESLLIDNSFIYSTTTSNKSETGSNITIFSPDVLINGGGIYSGGSAYNLNIYLNVDRLNMSDDGSISLAPKEFGQINDDILRNNNKIMINANEFISLSGQAKIAASGTMYSFDDDYATVDIGNIEIKSPEILITDDAQISTHKLQYSDSFMSGGNINIEVDRLDISERGVIDVGISGDGSGTGGNIDINASQYISINTRENDRYASRFSICSSAKMSSSFGSLAAGMNAGSISLYSKDIYLNGGGVYANSYKAGSSGNININANTLKLSNGGSITSTLSGSNGISGDIYIYANELVSVSGYDDRFHYTEGHSLISTYKWAGDQTTSALNFTHNGGNITIVAPELIIDNHAGISSQSNACGNAGNVLFDVKNLRIMNDGFVDATMFSGDDTQGGDIIMKVSEYILLDGGGVVTKSSYGGNAGNIYIESSAIDLFDSSINSSFDSTECSNKSGNAGEIQVTASKYINIIDSFIYAELLNSELSKSKLIIVDAPDVTIYGNAGISTSSLESGSSGDIFINTDRLNIINGGKIYASILKGIGKAGEITINASDYVFVSGFQENEHSRIESNSKDSELAFGGNVNIFSHEIKISDGGSISCSSYSAGPAGEIRITGDSFFNFSGLVDTTADSSGGGNIFFNISDLFFMNNGSVTTAVSGGEGSGGSIYIEKPELAALRESRINASAKGGNGGDINISSDYFIKDISSTLDASSELGIDGRINIDSPYVDLNTGLVRLTGEYNDLTRFLHNPCLDRLRGKISTLTVGPRIAKRQNPFAYLESNLN